MKKTILLLALAATTTAFGQLSEAGSRKGGTTFGFNSADEAITATRKGPSEKERLAAIDAVRRIALETPLADAKSTNDVRKAIDTVCKFWRGRRQWERAAAFCGEVAAARAAWLGPTGTRVWLAREAGGYLLAGYEKSAHDLMDALKKGACEQDVPSVLEAIADESNRCRWDELEAFYAPYAAQRKSYAPVARMHLLRLMTEVARGKDDYRLVKSLYAELKATYDAASAKDDPNEKDARKRTPNVPAKVRGSCLGYLDGSWQDWEGSLAMRTPPAERDMKGNFDYAVSLVRNGRRAEAEPYAANAATNAQAKGAFRFQALTLQAYIAAKGPEDFLARIAALESQKDTLAAKGDGPVELDKRYLLAVRDAGRFVYSLSTKPEILPYVRALTDFTRKRLMHPEERVTYEARYLKDAPGSAEAALRTGVFEKLPQENRIGKYCAYNHFGAGRPGKELTTRTDITLVKSAERPQLAADKPGKEASVCVAFDDTGLHVYAKFNDPDARKTRLGLEDRANFEFVLNAGDGDGVWHWNMMSALDQGFDAGVEWDAPRKGYKIGRDYIKTDICSTDDCHVFHLFAPWILHWTRLPADGDAWRLALIAGWGDQFGALGGGIVHELGHAMKIVFRMSDSERLALRHGLLNQAAGEFKRVNAQWEKAGFWEDPHMGDPDFYYRKVEPLVIALNKEVKLLADGPDEATFERLWNERLETFAEFTLTVDALRRQWLEQELEQDF